MALARSARGARGSTCKPWFAVALVFAVTTGCGGPSDAEQISSVVKRFVTSSSIDAQCELLVSERFVADVYGDVGHCRRGEYSVQAEQGHIDEVKIADTRIKEAKGTTGVMFMSRGDVDVVGRVALVKVGDIWKVDRLGLDLLRSMTPSFAAANADSVVDRREVRCLARATAGLSTSERRSVGYAFVGDLIEEGRVPDDVLNCVVKAYQRGR